MAHPGLFFKSRRSYLVDGLYVVLMSDLPYRLASFLLFFKALRSLTSFRLLVGVSMSRSLSTLDRGVLFVVSISLLSFYFSPPGDLSLLTVVDIDRFLSTGGVKVFYLFYSYLLKSLKRGWLNASSHDILSSSLILSAALIQSLLLSETEGSNITCLLIMLLMSWI